MEYTNFSYSTYLKMFFKIFFYLKTNKAASMDRIPACCVKFLKEAGDVFVSLSIG